MFGYSFYHGSIRRYIILFGTLFNDIYISRNDANGNVTSQFRVPITYGPKEKALARVEADPELNRPWASILPFMSFKLVSFYYDADRHLKKVGRVARIDSNKNLAANVYNPVPYTFNFELEIVVKNVEDGTKIIEQVAPWFTPDWTTTVRIIDDPEILVDIPVVLNPITTEDSWMGGFEERRYITYTLSFQMHGYLFGPSRKNRVIKVAKTRLGVHGSDKFDSVTSIRPGLTADGRPTTVADESVPFSEIDWDDDYGFIISSEDEE